MVQFLDATPVGESVWYIPFYLPSSIARAPLLEKKQFQKKKFLPSSCADVSEAPILRAPFSLPFHRIFPNIIFYAYIAAGKNPFPLLFLQENQQLVSICFSLLVLSLGRSKGQRKRREARWQHVGNEAKIFFTKEILVIKKAANDAEEWNIGRQHRRR